MINISILLLKKVFHILLLIHLFAELRYKKSTTYIKKSFSDNSYLKYA